ncbi:MAG: hypothetical protein ACREXP_00090 [Steroidobacteraceae bacterium]
MAFASFISTFSRVTYNSNGPSFWSFKGTDATTAVDAAGYFNSVADRVKVGDLIFYYKTDATVASGIYLVNANSRDLSATPPVSGVVDVANIQTIQSAIDSD